MKIRSLLLAIVGILFPFVIFAQENAAQDIGIDEQINLAFKPISDFFSNLIFFTVFDTPFVLILLVASAAFFTVYFGFVNVRHFKTAINVVRGKYDSVDPDHGVAKTDLPIDGDILDTIRDESSSGEVTHYQALATAVSGTVGNGNIAGVALLALIERNSFSKCSIALFIASLAVSNINSISSFIF